ncbi:uncharacterized protein [Littorina saxatilis]|uniref:uncharacterized protein n=1 Tax=Littorina saxatilis TaxID=31220 RepID=UPI0038B45C96
MHQLSLFALSVLFAASCQAAISIPPLHLRNGVFPGINIPGNSCVHSSSTNAREKRHDYVTTDGLQLAAKYAQTLVINRGLFFTMAMQFLNESRQFESQPGFLYYYVSAATAVFSGPPTLVGSGVFFDTHRHYPNWLSYVAFNETLPLFGPKASRISASELRVDDYGADNTPLNYLDPSNYESHLPTEVRSVHFKDKFGDVTRKDVITSRSSFRPQDQPLRDECVGGQDTMVLTLTSPVVEVLGRYVPGVYSFVRKPRHVAVTSVSVDIDILGPGVFPEALGDNMLVPMGDCSFRSAPPVTNYTHLPARFFLALNSQYRIALRLAHSLSAFLQNRDTVNAADLSQAEIYSTSFYSSPSSSIKVDKNLDDVLLEAEVLSNVLADSRILASGIFFDVERNVNNEGFSTPSRAFEAYRSGEDTVVADQSASYSLQSLLMRRTRMDWEGLASGQSPGASGLKTYTYHANIRSSIEGGGLSAFAVDPLTYHTVSLGQARWTSPYYKCDGLVDDWVVSYAAPFFGPSASDRSRLIFRGIVTVDIALTADNWNM